MVAQTTEALAPEALAGRLEPLLGGDRVGDVRPLPGGASSHTFRATRTGGDGAAAEIVVKVAPPGLAPVHNRDVLRQARAIEALHATDVVPVPRVLAQDPGAPPEVPPLFAMEMVPGESIEPLFDHEDADAGPASTARAHEVVERFHAAAHLLSDLHAIATDRPPFSAEAAVPLEDEVRRWIEALRSVDPPFAPEWPRCGEALLATAPAELTPVVVHGDFRLGNMLAEGPAIRAVIDWEIWTVGDPRLDLAWLRLNADPTAYRRSTPFAEGVPPVDELVRPYGEVGSVPDLVWFDALARFKAVAVWSLILKRDRGGTGMRFDDVAESLPGLITTAQAAIG